MNQTDHVTEIGEGTKRMAAWAQLHLRMEAQVSFLDWLGPGSDWTNRV